MTRKLFVTTALPYANGPFHIGHMMEYIQADIWVRFQRMVGSEVHFVCADDAHGAPIMIAAEKAGKTPQAFVAGFPGFSMGMGGGGIEHGAAFITGDGAAAALGLPPPRSPSPPAPRPRAPAWLRPPPPASGSACGTASSSRSPG